MPLNVKIFLSQNIINGFIAKRYFVFVAESKYEQYLDEVKTKNDYLWDGNRDRQTIENWLDNFEENEKEYALYLLTKFTFYKSEEIDQLGKSAFNLLMHEFSFNLELDGNSHIPTRNYILQHTKFFPMKGHGATSGAMLQYSFRHVNKLDSSIFLEDLNNIPDEVHEIVFIDDILGSGKESEDYWNDVISKIQRKDLTLYYIPYLGMKKGIERIISKTKLKIMPVIEISDMHQAFSENSIYFKNTDLKSTCCTISEKYGKTLFPPGPLGYGNTQLLVGFQHNVPDNTLPIIWQSVGWTPIFKRI